MAVQVENLELAHAVSVRLELSRHLNLTRRALGVQLVNLLVRVGRRARPVSLRRRLLLSVSARPAMN